MEQGKFRKFSEEDILLREGDQTKELYKLLSGKAAVYFNFGQANEYLVGILSEQRCFGELSILCQTPSVYTIVALTDGMLLRIPEAEFDDFIKNNSKNAMDIMRNLGNMLLTLRLDVNLVIEDMDTVEKEKWLRDISAHVRQAAALENGGQAFFSRRI